MKKYFWLFLFTTAIMMSSCHHRLCPTYTSKPATLDQLEKAQAAPMKSQEKENV